MARITLSPYLVRGTPTADRGRINIRLLFVMFAMLAFAADVRVRAVNASESADVLKAGYVYHFANLVEWPASVAPSGRPIVIGVLGNDDFATVLSGVVERKTLDDRTYVVKRLTSGDLKACACHILFVGGAYGEGTADIVALQNSASVLTIAEASDFARHGGIVSLTVDHRRVRLAVNVDAADRASLSISSRLLALATIVHTAR